MNAFDCRCGAHLAPPCPPDGGFLMQQIVGSGRVQLRCERFSLPLCGLPECVCPPLRVLEVCVSGACEGMGRTTGAACCGAPPAIQANVRIPLRVTLCDQRGCRFDACSSLEISVPMRLCRGADAAVQDVFCAHVRLARGGEAAPADCIQTLLDVCVQAWAVRCRVLCGQGCVPDYPPQLPLYPQPCYPPRGSCHPR